jgi:hypothetical protein
MAGKGGQEDEHLLNSITKDVAVYEQQRLKVIDDQQACTPIVVNVNDPVLLGAELGALLLLKCPPKKQVVLGAAGDLVSGLGYKPLFAH